MEIFPEKWFVEFGDNEVLGRAIYDACAGKGFINCGPYQGEYTSYSYPGNVSQGMSCLGTAMYTKEIARSGWIGLTIDEFWECINNYGKEYPEELPAIKTADALQAMHCCSDVKRTFKILWPTVFGDE